MKLKWYGTATLLIEQDGSRLLFDPFMPLNKKAYQPPIGDLATAQSVLVTHGHFDHVAAIPSILEQSGCTVMVYCSATVREMLIAHGVDGERIQAVAPDDVLDIFPLAVQVLKGQHIVFDGKLLISKLVSLLAPWQWGRLGKCLKLHRAFSEMGEVLAYLIFTQDKRLLLLGSLALDGDTEYPKGVDLLVLPLQGRSDIHEHAMRIVDRLMPRKILLFHFDDSFPPFSSQGDTAPFVSIMQRDYPDIEVICPSPGADWIDCEAI